MILSRYLTREVVQFAALVTAVLMLALLSQQVVRYFNYVAIGKIATNLLLELISFEVPYLLALLLPLGLYLGIILGYGKLYADNEMIVMQMAGYGAGRLWRLTSFIAAAASLLVLCLMLWVNPWISAKREALMQSDEVTVHLVQTMIPGRFQASPDGQQVMYVESLSLDRQRAENVFLAQEKANPADPDDEASWMLVFANQGYQYRDRVSHDLYFITTDGYRYEGRPGENDYKIIQFKKYAVRMPQNEVAVSHHQSEGMSTGELIRSYSQPAYAGELQWRVSVALAVFLLALLALPLSVVKPRKGRYIILLPAVLIYIFYMHLLSVTRHWVEAGVISVGIGMWWVHCLMLAAIGLFVMVLRYRQRLTGKTL